MADLIDRQAAIKIAEGYGLTNGSALGRHSGVADLIAEALGYLPTIEAAPVVHGRWIELPSMAPEYACSECRQSYEWWEVNEAHFCPNCGAKMDGRSDGNG